MGFILIVLGGVMLGSFAVPLTRLIHKHKFPWENTWVIYSLSGLLLYPWLLAYVLLPIGDIVSISSTASLAYAVSFGFLFGLGNGLFGKTIPVVGFSLAYTLNPSLVLCLGALIPIVMDDPWKFLEPGGIVTVAGVLVLVLALLAGYVAGVYREREFRERSPSPDVPSHMDAGGSNGQAEVHGLEGRNSQENFVFWLLLCMLSGLLAAQQNIGFVLAEDMQESAAELGIARAHSVYLSWALIMTGATLASLLLAIVDLTRRHTWTEFSRMFARSRAGGAWPAKLGLSVLMGILQTSGFVFYGLGSVLVGALGTSAGFAVFKSSAILTGHAWGFLKGDWTDSSGQTKSIILLSILLTVMGIIILAYGMNI